MNSGKKPDITAKAPSAANLAELKAICKEHGKRPVIPS